jgi:hypothetical protein
MITLLGGQNIIHARDKNSMNPLFIAQGAVAAGLLTNEQAQAFVDQQSDQEAVKP